MAKIYDKYHTYEIQRRKKKICIMQSRWSCFCLTRSSWREKKHVECDRSELLLFLTRKPSWSEKKHVECDQVGAAFVKQGNIHGGRKNM